MKGLTFNSIWAIYFVCCKKIDACWFACLYWLKSAGVHLVLNVFAFPPFVSVLESCTILLSTARVGIFHVKYCVCKNPKLEANLYGLARDPGNSGFAKENRSVVVRVDFTHQFLSTDASIVWEMGVFFRIFVRSVLLRARGVVFLYEKQFMLSSLLLCIKSSLICAANVKRKVGLALHDRAPYFSQVFFWSTSSVVLFVFIPSPYFTNLWILVVFIDGLDRLECAGSS